MLATKSCDSFDWIDARGRCGPDRRDDCKRFETTMEIRFDVLLESIHFHSKGGVRRHTPDVLFAETEGDCSFFN